MDSLNGRRIPADGKLSAEINAEHSARQQIEHEPKGRQPIRRLKIEIQQQPAQTAKDLKPPHPPPHQIAQLGSVVGPHPRHQPTPFEFRSARHGTPNATRSAESPYVQAPPAKRAARLYHNQPPRKLAERSSLNAATLRRGETGGLPLQFVCKGRVRSSLTLFECSALAFTIRYMTLLYNSVLNIKCFQHVRSIYVRTPRTAIVILPTPAKTLRLLFSIPSALFHFPDTTQLYLPP
jgi:hypothetical protein